MYGPTTEYLDGVRPFSRNRRGKTSWGRAVMIRNLAAISVALLTAGCVELTEGLMMYNDQLQAEQGNYFPDEHHSQDDTGNCPARWDYGRVNNQSYQRITNLGEEPASYTLIWSTGSESSAYLAPGETSEFFYNSPSIIPESVKAECGGG